MGRTRRRFALTSCWLAVGLTAVLWPLSNTHGRDGMGLAVGIRRVPSFGQRPGVHLIWGIIENNSGTEIWYFNGSIPFAGQLDMASGRPGIGLFGVRVISYAPNGADWYFAAALPFWLIALIGGVGIWRTRWRRPPL